MAWIRPAGHHPCLARGAYTGVRKHDKILTRLREIAIVGREPLLTCRQKLKRRPAVIFNIP